MVGAIICLIKRRCDNVQAADIFNLRFDGLGDDLVKFLLI